mmetsp:Transcript_142801/g.355915  ORF Transcript_142801/g.355915 Transcript_142801/m.355915 type:complete len:175 (-) Transcript_142801:7-531(-)
MFSGAPQYLPPGMYANMQAMGAGYPPHVVPRPGGAPAHPLTMVASATAFSGESARYPWYRVAFLGGVDLRQGPSVEAARTGETLSQNATFAAAEELLGADGRVYLRLADGRGWAFDDTALFPHDPAVIRGYWSPMGPAPVTAAGTTEATTSGADTGAAASSETGGQVHAGASAT